MLSSDLCAVPGVSLLSARFQDAACLYSMFIHQFSTGCCEDSSKSLHITCWNKLWLKLPTWLDISLQRLILCPSQSALPKSSDHPGLHRIVVPCFILEITISWCYLELSFAYKLKLMNSYKFVKCSRTLILREFFSTINFNLL